MCPFGRYFQGLQFESNFSSLAQFVKKLRWLKSEVSERKLSHLPVFAFSLILLISWIKVMAISNGMLLLKRYFQELQRESNFSSLA